MNPPAMPPAVEEEEEEYSPPASAADDDSKCRIVEQEDDGATAAAAPSVTVAPTPTAALPTAAHHIEQEEEEEEEEENPSPPSETAVVQDDEDDEDDEAEEDYEYEDEDDVAFSGFLQATAPAPVTQQEKQWKQPSQEAVQMSARVEQETTGGKRRLAADLYRCMNKTGVDRGFSLEPASPDNMAAWRVELYDFDADSHLAADLAVLNIRSVELRMEFPDSYPYRPPFCRVVAPRFQRQTGFVMNGALCMELLTNDGWNPVNDIESVIVSIRSLLVVGDGRLEAAVALSPAVYQRRLAAATAAKTPAIEDDDDKTSSSGAKRSLDDEEDTPQEQPQKKQKVAGYTATEASAAYRHLQDYHKKKGWDNMGWWARKG